jgi:hypothetical protein
MANRRSPTPHPVVLIQEMRVSLAVADLKGFDGASCETRSYKQLSRPSRFWRRAVEDSLMEILFSPVRQSLRSSLAGAPPG